MSGPVVAFVGLGNMGGPMCRNLLQSGYRVHGFDLDSIACQAAVGFGVRIGSSATDSAKVADIVITMLPAGTHVLETWGSIVNELSPGKLLIDCSTIDVESARKAHRMAAANGFSSLDAPVSGGVSGARQGQLTFMAGGASEAFATAQPILLKMGRRVFHCGGPGAGQAVKICNNMLLAVSMIGVSEALILGQKLKIEEQIMYDVITASSGRCWALETYCPVPGPVPSSPANHEYVPGFATSLMRKDLQLSQDSAVAAGALTPLAAKALDIYTAFANAGGSGQDFSGVIEYLRCQHRPV